MTAAVGFLMLALAGPEMGDVAATSPGRAPKAVCIRLPQLRGIVEAEREAMASDPGEDDLLARPSNRSECSQPRPCPFVSCRYHLAHDITDSGSLKVNFPGVALEDMAETCSLDVADQGPQTLVRLGRLFNVRTQRAHQMVDLALDELAAKMGVERVDAERALCLVAGRVPEMQLRGRGRHPARATPRKAA